MSFTGATDNDIRKMLDVAGVSDIEDLFADIPADIRLDHISGLPEPEAEIEVERSASSIEKENNQFKRIFTGAGAYNHYVPAAIDEIASRSEFYTSYTPYQPEVSQGTLAAIFEFQSMISRLNGMDVTNASLYDGATSMAEAALMAVRINGRKKILVSRGVHPNYRETLNTYSWAAGFDVEDIPLAGGLTDTGYCGSAATDVSAIIVQNPNFFGLIEDISAFSSLKDKETLLITVVVEALSLGILKGAGSLGAEIVCGEVQSFGNYLNFGGPYAGYISTKTQYVRKMPGRLVGQTVDSYGNRRFALTLQTREQHIRRERATSNICTNEGLIALRAAVYLALLGPRLRELSMLNHRMSVYMFNKMKDAGIQTVHDAPFFNEFLVKPGNITKVMKELNIREIEPGIDVSEYYPEYKGSMLICVTELLSRANIDQYIDIFGAADEH